MNRLAIFVEGYTEIVFLEKLIEEIAGEANVRIEKRQIRGGATARRTMGLIEAVKPDTGQRFYVLLVDCGGDALVKDRILEEHQGLTNRGYSKIIGLRDVRPTFKREDIPRLERTLRTYVKTSLIPVEFILSIMEVEAWFLAEHNHFPLVEPRITLDAIRSQLGFDPAVEDMELREHPAKDLDDSYAIGERNYKKGNAEETVNAMDHAYVYLELREKFAYLDRLICSVEAFLAEPAV